MVNPSVLGTNTQETFPGRKQHWRLSMRSMNRRPVIRQILIFLGFLSLSILMTWPWVLHLRDASAGKGDPYAIAYYMWWDYHQTFHDPLNLFHSTVLYPYKYTLAFTESAYGV